MEVGPPFNAACSSYVGSGYWFPSWGLSLLCNPNKHVHYCQVSIPGGAKYDFSLFSPSLLPLVHTQWNCSWSVKLEVWLQF